MGRVRLKIQKLAQEKRPTLQDVSPRSAQGLLRKMYQTFTNKPIALIKPLSS
ncbi:MAG: hypothetical protein JGK24_11485 [Microcoleus sp. PH2017_29_MFU_D_A]|jgi:hypothetical protein|nr:MULTISPECIES: hypothetical protein [unclassified Microcoleus]MCC3425183.1 hypothetical protein [Microcoleus sp. PH2017_01_SCD_O_A]MCC3433411.1 hypothetical protein [Microcoleus sp. PH2017_04_SCI_O_A]MCC3442465.1 hypothetical protein [Microcoleus sp. PH2017_03_ELD_O_A]MCC3469202.1 hypothetical protein [Microcoleus sp. PH2017_06_SFM_O_A]MCC3503677.1 hypothetical protein [Microcoleus sp. PH2017_19_SFW_U_A]MCC3511387.1 hypothetical protein [Microcoleus sp. PH2017_17_BER_D_A]MCC3641630.1 hypot